MKTAEKVECILILAAAVLIALQSSSFPDPIEAGYLILALGLLFLVQTLLRDLWLLWKQRSISRDSMPTQACMCLESSIGFVPVILSAILLATGISRPVAFSGAAWTLSAASVMLAGFILKDYVVEWKPWRIRKDPDHVNMRFSWNRT